MSEQSGKEITQGELDSLKTKVAQMEQETFATTKMHVKTTAMLRKLLSERGQHFDSAEFVLTRIKKGHRDPFALPTESGEVGPPAGMHVRAKQNEPRRSNLAAAQYNADE